LRRDKGRSSILIFILINKNKKEIWRIAEGSKKEGVTKKQGATHGAESKNKKAVIPLVGGVEGREECILFLYLY
jgi:hypothetical protein